MKSYLSNKVLIWAMSLCLSIPAHAAGQNSQADEYWLVGSFLASLLGLVILVRVLRP
jgi:hypothetical protein